MNVHCCLIDKHCRQFNPPPRLHINNIFGWCIIIALGSRGRTQEWRPSTGYTTRWRRLVIQPPRDKMCVHNEGPQGCGRLAGHRGPHAPPIDWTARRTGRTEKDKDTM